MTYEISPSTLKAGVDDKFGCPKCLWLKLNKGVRPPFPEGLGKIHTQIHDWFFDLVDHEWPDVLPAGKLLLTEEWLRAKPRNDIQLFGRIDGLIQLDSGGYAVIDLKTISKPDARKWAEKNYALQVNCYRYMLERAEQDYPNFTPVKLMGVVTFCPDKFAIRHKDAAGFYGSVRWHEIRHDDRIIGEAVGKAAMILARETPPAPRDDCEWCQFYDRWGVDFGEKRFDNSMGDELIF